MVGLKTFRGDSKLSTWFWSLAQNEVDRALQGLIQNRKRFQSLSTYEAPVAEERAGETSLADLPAKSVSHDAAIDLEKVRQDLPVKQDELVHLVVEGYSLAEVAKRLGVPLGTVRGRYRLAKKKMAERVHKKKPRR
jgi:RNA polymerase sigma-70 factor (ECF subfamily)